LPALFTAAKEGEGSMKVNVRKIAAWFSVESEEGVTALEYGLIASLIAITIIVGVTALGTKLNTLFNYIAGQVTT
jgi:pilus assembly protein Flp/PilA